MATRWTVALYPLLVGAVLAGRIEAADYPVAGTQLTLRLNPATHRGVLSLVLRDGSIPAPVPDGADDPSLAGMTLTVFSRGSGERSTFSARAGRDVWKVRATPKVVTYGYTDRAAQLPSAAVSTAQLRTGAGVKLRAKSPGITLDGLARAVAVRAEWGSVRVCAVFDGDAVRKDKVGLFVASGAAGAGLADCDDDTLFVSLPPLPCGTSPLCNGECPLGTECSNFGNPIDPTCECVPTEGCPGGCPEGWICAYPDGPSPTCLPPFCNGNGACDGACSQPGTDCLSVLGLCLCMTPCSGGDPYPTCGGACADPAFTCRAVPDSCVCAP